MLESAAVGGLHGRLAQRAHYAGQDQRALGLLLRRRQARARRKRMYKPILVPPTPSSRSLAAACAGGILPSTGRSSNHIPATTQPASLLLLELLTEKHVAVLKEQPKISVLRGDELRLRGDGADSLRGRDQIFEGLDAKPV